MIPGLSAETYHLKSGNKNFCTRTIQPKVGRLDDKLILKLDARNGFVWTQINEADAKQEIVENGASSVLTLIAGGSERTVLKLDGRQIELSVENVIKDARGIWQVDRRLEGYSCLWSAK